MNTLVERTKQLDALEFFLQSAIQGLDALQKDYTATIANAMNANVNHTMQNNASSFYLDGQTQLIYLLEAILKQLLEFESKVLFSYCK